MIRKGLLGLLAVGCCAWVLALGGCGRSAAPEAEPESQKSCGLAVRRTFSPRRVSVRGERVRDPLENFQNLAAGGPMSAHGAQ
ncbi:MAG: hypothetical protein LBT98_01740 [Puniceicoccales bacterium]|nr:hypothetical protein [Puniceicoccales bacterium]